MNTKKPTLLILAAGMGSRYGGLKQLDPVGPSGETILDYSIYDAMAAGFGKVVFVIRRDFEEEFKQIVGARYEKLITVEYVFQELTTLPDGFAAPAERSKPWGTGHAILMAQEVIQEPFGVINADDFYGRNAYEQLATFLMKSEEPHTHTMVAYKLRNTLSEHGTVSRGVCQTNELGQLLSVEEVTAIAKDGSGAKAEDRNFTGDELVSMNLWGFQPSVFTALENQFRTFLSEKGQEMKSEFYIPFVIDEEIRAKRAQVKVLETDSQWTGVTYREDKPAVQAFIQNLISQAIYPSNLHTQPTI
ncbi:sugar phosphate nucleotidyltransferase [Coraliomargarita algicola]|uniref:Sugar phosphate nucleotidyltransferase n=1 Tax=Coraliomargarita algicola TaxID=3092156 RepID=A0ABZ0RJU5_9BACT|nr:sugar phosphate nucleotidyltransferase [Coraliomargarita sp. J2-16]WPJ95529.1 sugar phosphate nucleotidyltransferase [Coraliomargarita sp. J2-16]